MALIALEVGSAPMQATGRTPLASRVRLMSPAAMPGFVSALM
eukprot:CAMPEP_0181501636 /NCGR_PEP_ID=MMETSP1110-20121109/55904_1 /TAXON_ID=174948 /ORGANISM="Symbiodinium sp., Strain CCMP421" /LENGTH=41 /DNA_ID= /DNA_START= /DNA_END= /DNA_ORIENTATION=